MSDLEKYLLDVATAASVAVVKVVVKVLLVSVGSFNLYRISELARRSVEKILKGGMWFRSSENEKLPLNRRYS